MLELPSQMGMNSLMHFFTILDIMSSSQEFDYLSSPNYKSESINSVDEHRMEVIYNHVLRHYNMDIPLKEISGLINLTPPSFCRYFKLRTNKSISSFVNEN